MQINEEPVNIKETIDTVVKKMKQQTMSRQLIIDCDESMTVNADRVRLQRILHNLLDNAIKYSAPGTKIEIFARRNNNEVLIGVRGPWVSEYLRATGKTFRGVSTA